MNLQHEWRVPGQPKQPKDVSAEVGIQRRDDLTIESVKKLIMRAIEEYRNDRDPRKQQDHVSNERQWS